MFHNVGSNAPLLTTSSWVEEFSYEQTVAALTGLVQHHASKSGPYAETIQALAENRDYVGLAGLSIDYRRGSPEELYHARQCRALFEKFEHLKAGIDQEFSAWSKFLESEAQCKLANARFRAIQSGGVDYPPDVASVLLTAQRKIADCLGDVPKLDELEFAFGPGANTSVKARASSARWKLDAPLTCSHELESALSKGWLNSIPEWLYVHRSCDVRRNVITWSDGSQTAVVLTDDDLLDYSVDCIVEQNGLDYRLDENFFVDVTVEPGKLQFVPKNYKTHRSIVVEPLLNSFFQKGVGKFLKGRLRRVGIDLTDQTRNKRLAQEGSISGRLATIDLSSASDTVSRELVWNLLPHDWVTMLNDLRTSRVEYKGNVIQLEKFSSMGNAYTFELESLIFWGLAVGVCNVLRIDTTDLSVYGDDIIVPVEAYDLLTTVLNFCGFSVNSEKSFAEGPFRESCGGDYVLGNDIRPFYQKHLVSGQTLFALHNFYMRGFFFEEAALVQEMIHPSLRIFGPDGYGDGHLIGSWTGRKTRTLLEGGWCGVVFDTFALKPKRFKKPCQLGDKVLPVYSIYAMQGSEDPVDHYVVRGSKGYRRMSLYTLSRDVFARL